VYTQDLHTISYSVYYVKQHKDTPTQYRHTKINGTPSTLNFSRNSLLDTPSIKTYLPPLYNLLTYL
jgi:hypothetical protein